MRSGVLQAGRKTYFEGFVSSKCCLLLVGWLFACPGFAAEKRDALVGIFEPLKTEIAALSPDGKRLAYSLRQEERISILSLEVDAPKTATSLVTVAVDDYATGYGQHDWGNHPARIQWMQWVSPERLIVQSNMQFLAMRKPLVGTVYGFRFDGKEAGLIYSALDANGPVQVIDSVPGSPPKLVVAEPWKKGTDWKLVDVITGKSEPVGSASYKEMRKFLMDRDEAEALRRKSRTAVVEELLPARQLTWYEHHGESVRFLVGWQDVADPGAFVVVDPQLKKAWEFVRREQAGLGKNLHRSQDFDLLDQQGRRYTGTLVLPLSPRVKKAPLVLYFAEQLGQRVRGRYRPEIQALAEMGFAVAVVDGLSFSGSSRGGRLELPFERLLPEGRDGRFGFAPIQAGFVAAVDGPAEAAHQLNALQVLAEHFPVSRSAVAVLGSGPSAEAALTAVAAFPGRARCLVLVNPVSANRMLSREGYPSFNAAMQGYKGKPVESALFLGFRGVRGRNPELEPLRFAWAALLKRGSTVDMEFVSHEFVAGQPKAKAEVFREIEAFLVKQLISYSVKIGEMVEIESFPDAEPTLKK